MGMVVRTNTMALNAYRQLGMNNSAVAKSLEKLSSGFRINRAGDDAAGLAISEKMKAQITGLETASANAQDGISLIQTAEGNLTEVHSMLNRMVELATKSANGTYTQTERKALQDEVDSLLDEIDRISKSANFNGTNLLDGSLKGLSSAVNVTGSTKASEASTTALADRVTVADDHANGDKTLTAAPTEFTIDFADLTLKATNTAAGKGNITTNISIGGQAVKFWNDANDKLGTEITLKVEATSTTKDAEFEVVGGDLTGLVDGNFATIGKDVYYVAEDDTKLTFTYYGRIGADAAANQVVTPDEDQVKHAEFIPKGNLEVTATKGTGTSDVTIENRDNCHLTAITDPVTDTGVKRGGASLALTADDVKAGNQLKIGETTFTFVDKDEADVTGNEISIKDLTGDDLLKSVTRQLSHKTAQIKDGSGNAKKFAIGRGTTLGTIEIEEEVQADADDYGKFTAKQLKDAFSLGTPDKVATTSLKLTANPEEGDIVKVGDKVFTFGKTAGDGVVVIGATAADTLNNLATAIGSNAAVNGDTLVISAATVKDAAPIVGGNGLVLQIGDTAEDFNKMSVSVADMSANGLSLAGLRKTGIMTADSASAAIDKIKTAINTVSSTRAGMGALQNRLEHTINNLDVAVENLSAANSRIRDTDMAKEMMNYTKMNVLVQSAQAMLAQANQQPQSVLQLLQ